MPTFTSVVRRAFWLTRIKRLRDYLGHGFLELDYNTAERSMRGIAIGRKNYMFVGSSQRCYFKLNRTAALAEWRGLCAA